MGQGVVKLADDNNLDLELLPKNICVRAPRFTLHSQFLAPLVKYGKHSTAQYRRAKWSDVVGAHWRQSLMALYLYSVESLRTWVSGPIFPLSAYVQPHRLKKFCKSSSTKMIQRGGLPSRQLWSGGRTLVYLLPCPKISLVQLITATVPSDERLTSTDFLELIRKICKLT